MKTNPSRNRSLTTLLCAATASLLILSQPAQAGYIITLKQVGSNVVATGDGPIDLTGLSKGIPSILDIASVIPNTGAIMTGPVLPFMNVDVYNTMTLSGPTNFGSGKATLANSGSGDLACILPYFQFGFSVIGVPVDYVSGTPLSDTSTYNNATFASLAVIPGTYEWRWGTGANQNFTLQIGAAGVPDSGSTFGLLFLSLIGLFGLNRLRHVQLA